MRKSDIRLHYITHIDNLPSILDKGILSHAKIEEQKVPFTRIYDSEIINIRKDKSTPNGKSLWDYANLYFQPRNPMMYRVIHEQDKENLAIVGVYNTVLKEQDVLIADGNASSYPTQFYTQEQGMTVLEKQWQIIQSNGWNQGDGSKRKIMAECLVPDEVKPEHISSIFVSNDIARDRVKKAINNSSIAIVMEPDVFFQPKWQTQIGSNISLRRGDMFFSNLQTLTVSVNLQGIMGKGLASRAKYQFPDVYVAYQDACHAKKVRAGRPYLYKREASLDQELADLSSPLSTPNAVKWFLLFATKRRWQENSRLEDIEGSLDWVKSNFEKEGIQSLAMPGLGCGLGRLDWKDVGPVMCRYLHGMGILVEIYLPHERGIDARHLTESYLLPHLENQRPSF